MWDTVDDRRSTCRTTCRARAAVTRCTLTWRAPTPVPARPPSCRGAPGAGRLTGCGDLPRPPRSIGSSVARPVDVARHPPHDQAALVAAPPARRGCCRTRDRGRSASPAGDSGTFADLREASYAATSRRRVAQVVMRSMRPGAGCGSVSRSPAGSGPRCAVGDVGVRPRRAHVAVVDVPRQERAPCGAPGPGAPEATSSVISATSRKPCWNAAQCSRSNACRSCSPTRAAALPHAPLADALAERLDMVQPRREQERQRRADDDVVEAALQLVVEPGHLRRVEDRAVLRLEHARGPRVDHDQPDLRCRSRGRSSTGSSRARGRPRSARRRGPRSGPARPAPS